MLVRLNDEQFHEVMAERVADGVPVRFLLNGGAVNIDTGEQHKRGTNVIYHPVYWIFTKETSRKIARMLGVKAVFDKA